MIERTKQKLKKVVQLIYIYMNTRTRGLIMLLYLLLILNLKAFNGEFYHAVQKKNFPFRIFLINNYLKLELQCYEKQQENTDDEHEGPNICYDHINFRLHRKNSTNELKNSV